MAQPAYSADPPSEYPEDVEAERRLLGAICYGGTDLALRVLDAARAILPSGARFFYEDHGAAYDAALALADRWDAACAAAGEDGAIDAEPIYDHTIRAELKVRARAGDPFAERALDLYLGIYSNRFCNAFDERSRLEPEITRIALVEEDAWSIVQAWAAREQLGDTQKYACLLQAGEHIDAQPVLERMQERAYTYLGARRPPTYERDEVRKLHEQIAEIRRIRRLPARIASPAQKLTLMYLKEQLVAGDEPRVLYDAQIGAECGISEDTAGKSVKKWADDGVLAKDSKSKPEYVDVPDPEHEGRTKTVMEWKTNRTLAIGDQWDVRDTMPVRQPRNHGGRQDPTICPKCGSHHVRLKTYQVCENPKCDAEPILISDRFANPADLDEAMARARMNPSDPQVAPVWEKQSVYIDPQVADRWKTSASAARDQHTARRERMASLAHAGQLDWNDVADGATSP